MLLCTAAVEKSVSFSPVQVATGKHSRSNSLSIPPPFVLSTEPEFHQSYQNYKCHPLCPSRGGIILQINAHMCQMVLLDWKQPDVVKGIVACHYDGILCSYTNRLRRPSDSSME